MKKIIQTFLILTTIVVLTGCNNKKEDLRPVSIGNLAFNYDANTWAHRNNTDEGAPLEFKDKSGNIVSIYVTQESTYQHPLDMIAFVKTMISSYEDYEVFLEPTKIIVNDTTWYEFGYTYKEGNIRRKVYQRYYGKYYNAASISLTSTEENYEDGYEVALKIMSDINATDVTNDINEGKAREFLVGEWSLDSRGYLVMYDDGTYEWYKDNTKDENNMHYGTYGCDVESATMGLKEGDGIYLVLFPNSLIINGVTEETTSYKNDYLISFDKSDDTEGYQMVNMSTYSLYTMIRQ
ncbi:hypothetical protein I5677_03485 [Mobilitalea sibirica]|uniref:Lipoprotein n=1 Tax=Mobilitalea sibirica TaxID=1462919 RepID=A0A8J7KW52_9FIRM|nr:hypothetical protein [Mobilitalea sibirica]MBH1939957.1 hypothetical protein [Mobilitalea sibirica]